MKGISSLIIIMILLPTLKSDLTIHLIAHSHMDPGWIKTDEQFFSQDVRQIYDNVYKSLMNKPERKFVFAEIINFKRWYEDQSNQVKENVKKMVKNGRIEIVGGGYVMHDEATPHYQDIIDQMRFGMKFCMNEFGVLSKTQWTIDPFGHSAANAYLMSQLGFKQIVVNRIQYQDFKERVNRGRLQFAYRPFNNKLGKKILYHIIPYHYGQGQCEYCYGEHTPSPSDYAIESSAKTMLDRLMRVRKAYTNPDIIMHLMGDDFTYKYEGRFQRNELVMNYINEHKYRGETIKIFYSTPREYFNAIYEDNDLNNREIPIETDLDFFPYADQRYAYWTGYFTSRPFLKGMVRRISNYLYTNGMFLTEIKLSTNFTKEKVAVLEDVRAVSAHMQHHDAVTGTSKEFVSKDFIAKCETAMGNANIRIKNIIKETLLKGNGKSDIKICLTNGIVNLGCQEIFDLSFNEGKEMVSLYNPQIEGKLLLSIETESSDYEYKVFYEEEEIPSDFYCINQITFAYKNKCILNFFFEFKASISIYSLTLQRIPVRQDLFFSEYPSEKISIIDESSSNNMVNEFSYDPISQEFNLKYKQSDQTYKFYLGYITVKGNRRGERVSNDKSIFDDDDQYAWPRQDRPIRYNGDGAYIFSPNMTSAIELKILPDKSYIYKGKLGFTMFINYGNESYLIPTIYYDPFFIKVEHILNKKQRRDLDGANLLFKINTDINNELTFEDNKKRTEFWTDSNGVSMMRRIKDHYIHYKDMQEEKTSNNFYPVTSCISIRERKDNNYSEKAFDKFNVNDRSISVFNDKSQSGSSLNNGEILLLIQRHSLSDDQRGVAENLFEDHSFNKFFKFCHFIFFGSNLKFDGNKKYESFVYNYMHNTPLLFSRTQSIVQQVKSELNEMFIVKGENVRTNVEIVNDKLIIVQFYNHFDPYFEDTNLKSSSYVELNTKKIEGKIYFTTDYNGLKYIAFKGNDIIKMLISNKQSKIVLGENDFAYYYLFVNSN